MQEEHKRREVKRQKMKRQVDVYKRRKAEAAERRRRKDEENARIGRSIFGELFCNNYDLSE